ncbi:MAG: hypothetical protein RL456_2719 [Pseudomonadota bacterium]|jgi:serine/threonine protein phosphatase PrpC
MMQLDLATCLEPGARDHNEDDLRTGQDGALSWAVLSDGAGGHSRGDEASRQVVSTLDAGLAEASRQGAIDADGLGALVRRAHQRLCADAAQAGARQRMHATVVALWLDRGRGQAVWAHVGDSRLYLVRDGVAAALTRDDSVVQQMVDAGFLSAEDARHHPRKNQLLSALGGVEGDVEVHLPPEPLALRDGDGFLLCSDGWWDVVEAPRIAAAFGAGPDAAGWIARMDRMIRDAARPQQDNYSAIGLRLRGPAG